MSPFDEILEERFVAWGPPLFLRQQLTVDATPKSDQLSE